MDRVVYALFCSVRALVRPLSISQAFRLGALLGQMGWIFAWPYRNLVLRNLRIAFGHEGNEAKVREIARRHFRNLGGNLFASLKLPLLAPDELRSIVTVEGLPILEAGARTGRGFVMAINHIGNWEMFGQLSPIIFPCKTGTIYQRLGNRFLDAEVRHDRARLGLALFERKEGFAGATKFLRSGGACGVLIDQHAGDGGLWCLFFGRLASTSTLAATLALRAHALIVPAAVFTNGAGRWRVEFAPAIDPDGRDVSELTATLNAQLEQFIRQQPEDWFWVHNRWKTPSPKFLLAGYKRGVHLPPTPSTAGQIQPFRMAIRASNWLGDAVMSAPAVRAIKHGRPDAHVTVVTPAKLADFWRTIPEVDAVLSIGAGENLRHVARRLHHGRFDAAIILPNSFRTAFEAWLARIPRRVGYPGHYRRGLLNQILRSKKKRHVAPPPHHTRHYLALADFIGATAPVATPPRLPIDRTDAGELILGVCPGAEYGPAKRWLPERFAEVMQEIARRHECTWKLFGVQKDREIADDVLGQTRALSCIDLVGRTSLAELMRELQTCRVLVTNDTGTMHLAAHLGVPVVALFGSTEPALTGPRGSDHRVLRHHVPCSPCFLRECPLDFRCMRAIPVGEVVMAIESALRIPTHTQHVSA
jgi:lipopolysaccharide heptosyltransferase II